VLRQMENDDGERCVCQSLEYILFSIMASASGLTPLIAGRQNKLDKRALSVQTTTAECVRPPLHRYNHADDCNRHFAVACIALFLLYYVTYNCKLYMKER
jgi:hypothetical protein